MTDMDSIKESIRISGERVLAVYHKRFTPEIMATVTNKVLQVLSQKSKLNHIVSDADVKVIRAKLIPKKNARTRTAWLHLSCYNKLAAELNKTRKFKCRFIYIPTQVTRALIVRAEDDLQENVRLVQIIHDELLTLRYVEDDDIELQELECVCSFIAAAGIFGKMMFEDYHRRLLDIKLRDVHFLPICINVPYKNSDAFYRYFLPYPASAYFMRCVRFYQRNYRKLKTNRPFHPEDHIITPVHFTVNNLAPKFKQWTAKLLQAKVEEGSSGISIVDFRSALKSASQIDLAPEHLSVNAYPPFVISVQSGVIRSYSYGNEYFPHYLGITPAKPDYRCPVEKKEEIAEPTTKNILKKALAKIRKERRALLELPDTSPLRREAAEKILSIVESYEGELKEGDYINLELFALWIDSMLQYKTEDEELIVSSVNNYIPKIEKLLHNLPSDRSLLQLSKQELTAIVARTMRPATSRAIKKVIKEKFFAFVKSEKKEFKDLDWNKPELAKEDIPSLKPFVTPADLKKGIDAFSKVFTAKTGNRETDRIDILMLSKTEYKAISLQHMAQLSYYTGMRINEIASLRIQNVICDGDIVLSVRISKTRNGIRNIPLGKLAPAKYVAKFKDFYEQRRTFPESNRLLFPDYNGKKWRTNVASREVAKVFRKIISSDFRFHNLRDSFASQFLLRVCVAFSREKLPDGLPFYNDELFSEENLSKLRKLVLGTRELRTGQEYFTYAIAVLARLMGHGGPRVTFECYLHTTDWIFYLLSERNKINNLKLSSDQTSNFYQVAKSELPEGVTTITVDTFTDHHRSFIRVAKIK